MHIVAAPGQRQMRPGPASEFGETPSAPALAPPTANVVVYAVGCIKMKAFRQAAILELLDHEAVPSQEALRRRLRARGIDATQATISRDLKELGLLKRAADGAYQRADRDLRHVPSGEQALRRAVVEYLSRLERVRELVVLRTGPGQAHALAAAIDRHPGEEVAGTIAGDDTILVIARDGRRAAAFARRLEGWARG
jgi:transcriptional regulator of arginine metabolism